jgi:hypothetical protein
MAVNAASYVIAGALLLSLPPVRPMVSTTGCVRSTGSSCDVHGCRTAIRDHRYLRLAFLNTFVLMHNAILTVAMPLWVVRDTSALRSIVGVLFDVNTFLVVALQVRASDATATPNRLRLGYSLAAAGFLGMGVAFALASTVGPAAAVVLLLMAVSALTTGELFAAAGEWCLSVELAPPALRGRYRSTYRTAASLQQAAGAAIVTFVLASQGRLGWMLLAAVPIVGAPLSAQLGSKALNLRGFGGEGAHGMSWTGRFGTQVCSPSPLADMGRSRAVSDYTEFALAMSSPMSRQQGGFEGGFFVSGAIGTLLHRRSRNLAVQVRGMSSGTRTDETMIIVEGMDRAAGGDAG